jgi:putative membrane protein
MNRPTAPAKLYASFESGRKTMILQSLAGLPAFLVYFCTAIIAVVAYLLVYTRITPHNEFQLIRDNDPAAAIALGLSLLGFGGG